MVILGFILLLFLAGAGAWLYLALSDLTTSPVNELTALGVTIGFSPLALLAIGFGLALALAVAFALIRSGISRKSRQRKERKDLERQAQQNRDAAEAAAAKRLESDRNAPRSVTAPTDQSSAGWKAPERSTDAAPPPPPPRA